MSFNDVNYEPIECPYCGSKTVEVTIITSLYFKKVVRVYKNGIDYYNNANEESIKGMNEILGEPCFEPTIELTCFDCSSCKKHWISKMYKMVKGDNGLFSFVENEDTGRKGKMPKYIDADKLAAELSAGGIPINEQGIAGILGDMSSIQDYIDDAPSEDVAPVRHGEWFGTVCSACGESTSFYYDCDYCPKCGAKMDGETDQSNTGRDMIQWEDDLMKSQDDKKKRRISKLHRILGGLLLGISLLGFSFVVGSGAGAIMAISGAGICLICLLWLKINGGNQNDK